jgi:hypothetical protein
MSLQYCGEYVKSCGENAQLGKLFNVFFFIFKYFVLCPGQIKTIAPLSFFHGYSNS